MAENIFRVVIVDEDGKVESDRLQQGHFSERHSNHYGGHDPILHHNEKRRIFAYNSSNQIVGECEIIPTVIWLLNREVPALFWAKLYVLPEWRGRGIQRQIDLTIRQIADLKLGFPHKLAATIHRKHGWRVREDYRVMMLPLIPQRVAHLGLLRGGKHLALQCAAQLVRPAAWLYRRWLRRYKPSSAQILEDPDAEFFASVFLRYRKGWIATNRSADYIRRRYLESACRSQYAFFSGGSGTVPSLVAISRTLTHQGVTVTRILDIFGDLGDRKGLPDLLKLVVREAIKNRASQVTAVASNSVLMSVLRANGFIANTKFRFCWFSHDQKVMRLINEGCCHWVLADSDNDPSD